MIRGLALRINDWLARRKFERMHAQRPDVWRYDNLRFEQNRFALIVSMLQDRRYENAAELGCAEGALTERLAPFCGKLLAVDLSETALVRARLRLGAFGQVRFVQGNLRDWRPDASNDLIVVSEVLYYLGERNDLVKAVADRDELLRPVLSRLAASLSPGGRLLLAHSFGAGRRAEREAYRRLAQESGLRLCREEEVAPTGEPGTDHCLVSLLEKS